MSEPGGEPGDDGAGWLAGLLAALIGVSALLGCCAGSVGLLAVAGGSVAVVSGWLSGNAGLVGLGVVAAAGAIWHLRRRVGRCDMDTRKADEGRS